MQNQFPHIFPRSLRPASRLSAWLMTVGFVGLSNATFAHEGRHGTVHVHANDLLVAEAAAWWVAAAVLALVLIAATVVILVRRVIGARRQHVPLNEPRA